MIRWTQTEDAGLLPARDVSGQLATLIAAAMAFVAAIILALALTAARTAGVWTASVAPGLTVELPFETPPERQEAVVAALADLPGVAGVRVMPDDEKMRLLSPWLGQDIDVARLRLPVLIDVTGEPGGDAAAEVVAAEVPQAVVTDHAAWREPVLSAASRIRIVALSALFLTVMAAGGVVWLAVTASAAAAGRTVEVLRLVGASDAFVVSRFARPFAVRSGLGAAAGAAAALLALILVRLSGATGSVVPGPVGYEWLWLPAIPLVSAGLSWLAARMAVARVLRTVG